MPRDVTREFGYLTLGSRLKRMGERFQAETARFMLRAGIDIPPSASPLLVTLREGPMTIGELAAALGVSQPGVTRSVRQLEAAGLVEAAPAGSDQRRRPVMLTEKAAGIVDRAQAELWPHVEAAVREMCGAVEGSFLQQLDAIEDALDRMPIDRRAEKKIAEANNRD